MNDQKILNLLGLATKAGKIVTGEELTIKDIRNQKTALVFIAKDASKNTKKKLADKCIYYHIPINEQFTQLEISQAIGKVRMIVGMNDQGFTKKIKELMKE
ncbi:YlxQ-related RNA-binding protein [Melissococcus plutonius]|uniref:Ribosomal protein L7A family n=2 Tax=Melissococcus plutonius TaxID=33970 RepID=F3YB53_MELPT|nr:YlxQ-related RNA-binding protein [Melissococcus plutonius]AIM25155.1 putative ribosomal protein YlxQ [Melissococcus plutonius S1]KMT25411.1 putative ribosomal protein YlxQ [Melissococcus plutonius]KMT25451.1 putative ribosomal protein YlxQ [Melissococcus plutonius]KMT26315.1 putative ribosomal protein YlxQ [Melissococcus plutonius]KMT29057.1 putative ribosomal protein YlxQ [Melissococcus plutonius]